MAKFSVDGLQDAVGDVALERGKYAFSVLSAEIKTKDNGKQTLFVTSKVESGPEQLSGRDPINNKVMLFFQLNGYETHKDGGKFAKGLLKDFLNAVGIDLDAGEWDTDDMVEAEFSALNRVGTDQDGYPSENWSKYQPISEEY